MTCKGTPVQAWQGGFIHPSLLPGTDSSDPAHVATSTTMTSVFSYQTQTRTKKHLFVIIFRLEYCVGSWQEFPSKRGIMFQSRLLLLQLNVLVWFCCSNSPCRAFLATNKVPVRNWIDRTTTGASSSSLLFLDALGTDGGGSSYTETLLPSGAYDTIREGRIAVIPNFISESEILALRSDAQALHASQKFSTDALASYGTSGKFDPSEDRAVLRLNQWKDESIGHWETRRRFGNRMAALRTDLAYHLHRPKLDQGLAVTKYGQGSTEISYTRFGPGAFLKRHVDEHHEELKGRAGWAQPTRRSISWLIYLNQDWNGRTDGGQLRCFQRTVPSVTTNSVLGARPNGDLQVAWLQASALDPIERPVYLDGRRPNHKCSMYIVDENDKPVYISKDFETNPIFYMAGSETLVRRLLVDRRDLAERVRLVEPPKSRLGDLLSQSADYQGQGEAPASDEVLADVDPIGGTLVLFDSVSLPHEVLACRGRDRWATSGWFHEDQQQPVNEPATTSLGA